MPIVIMVLLKQRYYGRLNHMDIANQTVVIIGGGSGIGLGVARACLNKAARIVIAGRHLARLERALIDLEAGDRGRACVADVTIERDVEQLFASTERVDHVVVTAADLAYQPIERFDAAAARRALDSKLLGALLVAKHAAPRLSAGGSLTLTTGVAAERPLKGGSMVAAVNGGLQSFVRGAALELAPIRVNALSPGWVDTELWNAMALDKTAAFAAMAQRLPVGRIGQPADLGHAAIFLMENGFTTGAVLTVDGGHRFV